MLVNVFPNASLKGFFATNYFFGLKLQIDVGGKGKNRQMRFKKLMQGNFILFSSD